MPDVTLPAADAVATMLENLLGRDVFVKPGTDIDGAWVGRYITDDGEVAAACVADVAAVAYAGSALSMVPPAQAQAASGGAVTDAMVENFHEVLNVAASLIIDAGSEHVRLDGMHHVSELDQTTSDLISGGGTSAPFTVDIDGYGVGALAFVAA